MFLFGILLVVSSCFSFSPEEMAFSAKLSDQNRKKFCFEFSPQQRLQVMLDRSSYLSPDERVEMIDQTEKAQENR